MNAMEITKWQEISLSTMQPCIDKLSHLSPKKEEKLKLNLTYIKDLRRNQESHMILKTQVKWSVNNDMEKILATINELIEIFHKT